MADQLTFDLPVKSAFGREDFFVSESNAMAVRLIEEWQEWPNNRLLLLGPKGSGKSHLSAIWAEEAGATMLDARGLADFDMSLARSQNICVENLDVVAQDLALQEALFHLFNLSNEGDCFLLLSTQKNLGALGLSLPDLQSRLASMNLAKLQEPDDILLSAIMLKQFADRQLRLDPKVLDYLLPRMDRSFEMAMKLVDALDRWSLREKKRISVASAKDVMNAL